MGWTCVGDGRKWSCKEILLYQKRRKNRQRHDTVQVMRWVRGGCYTGAEIWELICSPDRSIGSSSRSCSIFSVHANERVLNSTDSCKKVHTLPISLYNLVLSNICFPQPPHVNFRAIAEGADLCDVARQKLIIWTGVRRTAVKVLLRP